MKPLVVILNVVKNLLWPEKQILRVAQDDKPIKGDDRQNMTSDQGPTVQIAPRGGVLIPCENWTTQI